MVRGVLPHPSLLRPGPREIERGRAGPWLSAGACGALRTWRSVRWAISAEQPREFVFVLNLKTARTLGLAIPRHVLLQASAVIE